MSSVICASKLLEEKVLFLCLKDKNLSGEKVVFCQVPSSCPLAPSWRIGPQELLKIKTPVAVESEEII